MILSRRKFLGHNAAAIAGLTLAHPLFGSSGSANAFPSSQDSQLRQLIETAIDAAVSAGATYADARLTFSQTFTPGHSGGRQDTLGIGVRALFAGYWGFSASPVWSISEAVRLGRAAAANAKANEIAGPRDIILAPNTPALSGDWVMPIKDDPFEIAVEELMDFSLALKEYPNQKKLTRGDFVQSFSRQQKAFGNSAGQFITQRTYRSWGRVKLTVTHPDDATDQITSLVPQLSYVGMGFEHMRDQPIRQYIDELHEELLEEIQLPRVSVDVGKYPVLLSSRTMADMVSQSIGVATEVDRAMGFESNASGTSYIIDPDEMLGTLQVAAPSINVSGNRSAPGSVGRVRWDDEGVEPEDFTLVSDGVLVDMQTNREGHGWISPYYEKMGWAAQSRGCSYAPDAIDTPLVHSADLVLHPDTVNQDTIDTLRSGINNGVEWHTGANSSFDFQIVTGLTTGRAFKIENGKRVSRIENAGMLFKTDELWKNVQSLGGHDSSQSFGLMTRKGEPVQDAYHSVSTPPAVIDDMAIVDVTRKA